MPERASSSAPSLQPDVSRPQHGLTEDYAALEKTLRNSTLGRWFLAEHASRNRAPEIQLLLDAIARLEAAVLQPNAQTGTAGILAELVDIRAAISRMRREIAELNPLHQSDTRQGHAPEDVDQIGDAAKRATSDILSAAEDVQRVSRSLREMGAPPEICDRLDRRTVDIHIACASQDIAGEKTAKVVHVLNDVDQRIDATIRVSSAGDGAPVFDDTRPPTDYRDAPNNEMPNRNEPPMPWTPDMALDEAWRTGQARGRQEAADLGGERFKRPEPLTLSELDAIKRSALFG